MTLGRSTPATMDLAAFSLGDVVEVRPGVFRHPRSLAARIARLFGERPPAPALPETPVHLAARRRAAAKTRKIPK